MEKHTQKGKEGYMNIGVNMGRVVPMDVIDIAYKGDKDLSHIVFLLDDERFKNRLVTTPGLITFTDFNDSQEQISIYKSTPECLENSPNKWRLMDIDELEAFYDFYKQEGMGEFYDLVENYSYEYGSSDLVDIDRTETSKIYCVDFGSGKRRSRYQYQDKALMMTRKVTDDDIFSIMNDMLDRVSFVEFSFIAEKVIKIYPNLEDRIKSLSGDDVENSFKGSRLLRIFETY